MKFSKRTAVLICKMEEVCYIEGQGPSHKELKELFDYIAKTYPSLKKKFSFLPIWDYKPWNLEHD